MRITSFNSQMKSKYILWLSLAGIGLLLALMYHQAFDVLIKIWARVPDYSHGYIIPLLSLFVVWTRRDVLKHSRLNGMWSGVLIIVLGLCLYLIGETFTFHTLVRLSFVIVLTGIVLSLWGRTGMSVFAVPLILLLFMFPLPGGFHGTISRELQTISSQLGVYVIRLMGISVFLEGNVIDLGNYKLNVVDACSGLRYLFPLLSFGFICAYFFRTKLWLRIFVFISTIPIAIFMNGIRIGITGYLVDRFGIEAAEGFLHDAEGWVVFMACIALLITEIWLITKVARLGPFGDVFVIDFQQTQNKSSRKPDCQLPTSYLTAFALIIVTLVLVNILPERTSYIPQRSSFKNFPMTFADWQGKRNPLDDVYINVLKMTDYIQADYQNDDKKRVNLYISYYESSTKGDFLHSPSGCLPSDGWTVTHQTTEQLKGITYAGKAVAYSRAQIYKGNTKQLVYYWIQQSGRSFEDISLRLSMFRFMAGLMYNRTDNALIRLVTPLASDESWADADKRLQKFTRMLIAELPVYVPH